MAKQNLGNTLGMLQKLITFLKTNNYLKYASPYTLTTLTYVLSKLFAIEGETLSQQPFPARLSSMYVMYHSV